MKPGIFWRARRRRADADGEPAASAVPWKAAWLPVLVLIMGLSGCLQIEVMVEMHDKDPGATIRERIQLSRRLLDTCPTEAARKQLLAHLDEAAIQSRMKHMGKGISLVSHKTETLPDGAVESRAVYRIPDIEDLRISNPLVHESPPSALGRITYGLHRSKNRDDGEIAVKVDILKRGSKYPAGMSKKLVTPRDRQIIRDLKPVFTDMLSDFQATIKLKVPTRFTDRYVRNIQAAPKVATLFSISGADLDRAGNKFFENEEVLLAIMQMDFDSPVILEQTSAFPNNSHVPVVRAHGHGLYGPNRFRMLPTTYHAKKWLGKTKGSKK